MGRVNCDEDGNLQSPLLPRGDCENAEGGGPWNRPGCGSDGPGEAAGNPEERETLRGSRRIEEKREVWGGTRQHSSRTGRRETITYGRRLSRFLSGYRCYNPRRLDQDRGGGEGDGADATAPSPEGPSLDGGWAFFEHKTLPRHLINPGDGDEEVREENSRACPWKKEGRAKKKIWNVGTEVDVSSERTVLYDFWNTTEADLMDFGVGVALHFKQLRFMMLLMLCAGLVSLPNMIYYASAAYSKSGQGEASSIQHWGLVGSAVCTDQSWVACPTCPAQAEAGLFGRYQDSPNKIATTTLDDGSLLVFRMKNNCEVGLQQGMIALGCYIFLLIGTFAFQIIAERWEKRMDKTVQTADDYTVWVRNPPQDAEDPEEWRSFFNQFVSDIPGDHVVTCTVVRANQPLLLKLMQRKTILRKLELLDGPDAGSGPATLHGTARSSTAARLRHAVNSIVFDRIVSLNTDAGALESQIETLNGEISEMGKATFPVVEVFVTFETEHSMLAAMKALCLPRRIAQKQDKAEALDTCEKRCCRGKRLTSEDFLFRGDHVLYVDRPPPPSSICWEDLGVKWTWRYLMQAASLFLVACYVVAAIFLILWANTYGCFAASCMTAFLNLVVPLIILITSRTLEYHETEGKRDVSIFIQVSLFRWINTVMLSLLLVPLTTTLDTGDKSMPYKVNSLFISQLLFGPAIYLLDPMGQLEHHILAPRARNQRQINLCFQGSYWTLAERRTISTTIFFLSCFYSMVYPAGFFFGAVILLLFYFCDKFLLLRTWAPAPRLGGSFFAHVQQAFLTILIVVYGVASFFLFGGFPFDGICKTDSIVSPEYVGEHTATTSSGTNVSVFIEQDSINYQLCFQGSPDPSEADNWTWMTEGQKTACLTFFKCTVPVIGFLIADVALGTLMRNKRQECSKGNLFKCSDKPEDAKFSEERGMTGYVPHIKRAVGFLVPFTHPFVTVDLSTVDVGLVGWAFEGPESDFNLSKDFPELRHCFDIVRQWKRSGQVWGSC